MATKAKKGSKENPVKIDDAANDVDLLKEERDFSITEATIKDDFCNYKHEMVKGKAVGEKGKIDGPGLIMDSLRDAFGMLRVHLAAIDDVFKHSNISIGDIDDYHTHELTNLYYVTGFKVKGGKDNECVVLMGNKYVSSAGGRIEIETPKIPLDNLSPYKWHKELKVAFDNARNEVALYKEGNYSAVEIEEEEEDSRQLTIGHQMDENDLEGGKV